jgi:hypothetical protein
MRLNPVRIGAALVAACVSFCSTSTSGADSPFAGTWAQRDAVGGTSLVLTLEVNGSAVTGTGTYAVEGGRSGSLKQQGSISGDTLDLNITYDDGSLAQFTGKIARAKVMSGRLHLGPPQALTPSAIVTFDRKD